MATECPWYAAIRRWFRVPKKATCPYCWGNRMIFEMSAFGVLMPIRCQWCEGRGWIRR
jgi:hypothetical protein